MFPGGFFSPETGTTLPRLGSVRSSFERACLVPVWGCASTCCAAPWDLSTEMPPVGCCRGDEASAPTAPNVMRKAVTTSTRLMPLFSAQNGRGNRNAVQFAEKMPQTPIGLCEDLLGRDARNSHQLLHHLDDVVGDVSRLVAEEHRSPELLALVEHEVVVVGLGVAFNL